jgi:hypothetical protein
MVATAALLVIVVGVVLMRVTRQPPVNGRHEGPPTTVASPRLQVPTGATGPTAEVAGMPVGFATGEDGAVAAAISYATAAQRWLYFSDAQIEVAIAEIATPVAAPRIAEDVVADVSMARSQLAQSSGRVWWLVRPLAWRVDDYRDTQARMSVWTVSILSAAGVAAPQTEFVTVTLDLVYLDGDWRVDAVRDTPGPTPITGPHDQPWDAEPFDRALDGFTRMDGEPRS